MKNTMSKSILPVFGILTFLLLSLVSCKKDKEEPPLHEQMIGEWELRSFNAGGVELMGIALQASHLEFEKETGAEGDYTWFFAYPDGTNSTVIGVYEVDDETKKLVLDADTPGESEYAIYLDGEELKLSGSIDGSPFTLTLERD